MECCKLYFGLCDLLYVGHSVKAGMLSNYRQVINQYRTQMAIIIIINRLYNASLTVTSGAMNKK